MGKFRQSCAELNEIRDEKERLRKELNDLKEYVEVLERKRQYANLGSSV